MAIEYFKSRARVIDLLGRQQIADAPTATGELFKNALDAGATEVRVDYAEPKQQGDIGYLAIRDNGLGMRSSDVVNKWLVLATESKFAKKQDDGWAEFATAEQKKWIKTTYGEKGIGRLSVASLGRMTVLWSVWGKGKACRGTLCIVHWHLFQHPTKLLDELPIPCEEFDHAPTAKEFAEVFSGLKDAEAVNELLKDKTWDKNLREELESDLAISTDQIFNQLKCDFDMGTSFLCVNTGTDDLRDLFRVSTAVNNGLSDISPSTHKSTNAFFSFWDPFHKNKDRPFELKVFKDGVQLRGSKAYKYWSPEDFDTCDHHIRIEVSEKGYAKGSIRNYQSKEEKFERQLKGLLPGMKSPGPFLIEVGYVQGMQSVTFLPAELHKQMDDRLEYAGGFSVYKGNVHIQPYGAPDSDFAGFEQRRLKNAGRYYFSHLRMFGGVFLPANSTQLKEKAGREGFIVNGACRALKFWLEDVFVDIADRYLGRKADRDDKRKLREEKAKAAALARIEREKAEYLKQIRYARGWLNDFSKVTNAEVAQSRECLSRAANAAAGKGLPECEEAIDKLRTLLGELQASVSDPPNGVAIIGDALDVITDYQSKRATQITILQREITREEQRLNELASRAKPMQERERYFSERLVKTDSVVRQRVSKLVDGASGTVERLSPALSELVERELENLKNVREVALGGLTPRQVAEDASGESVATFEKAIQAELDELEAGVLPRLRTLCDNIQHLTDWQSGVFALSDQTRELQVLREQHSHLISAAQLGLVFSTATHEYEKQVASVRGAISLLSKRLSGQELEWLQTLDDSFSIIDERIRLMDPLIRRRSLRTDTLVGREIEDFLRKRFSSELGKVACEFSDAFCNAQWAGVNRPMFLGAIHNLFVNALYWARQGRNAWAVRLSLSDDGSLVISDSGPGVRKVDADYIFEPGFSRRPEGQGLGLYIARESLKEMGYGLVLSSEVELGALNGANFVIAKID